jgi:mannose-1-phosphate guanylyltransferase/mannose-6-phosphate isomerase
MDTEIKAVIIAGGSGTRLWPLSRYLLPKQFIRILGGRSLFEDTVERIAPVSGRDGILAVVNREHAFGSAHHILKPYQLLIEPEGRNTAPAIGLAAKYASRNGHDPVLVVLPSDHIVTDKEAFRKTVKTAVREACSGAIITLGIKPTHPETGYGYMQFTPSAKTAKSLKVSRFVEKPDLETARKYVESGRYLWNCGIFIFKASVLLKEIKTHLPRVYELLNRIEKHAFREDGVIPGKLAGIFTKMPSVSIDYGVMEKSSLVRVIPCAMGWNDVGSWLSLYSVSKKDKRGNVINGEVMSFDCDNSLIHSDSRLVAAIGLKDMALIETSDAILACPLARAQEVKKIVDELKLGKRSQASEHLTLVRPWGTYTLLEETETYKVKRLVINPGQRISLQFHRKRSEHWTVIKGNAEVVKASETYILRAQNSIDIPACTLHGVRNSTGTPVTIIEVQSGDYLGEDDIIRIEDDYGRAGR